MKSIEEQLSREVQAEVPAHVLQLQTDSSEGQASRLTTPEEFYRRITQREDIRRLLKRLADL